MHFTDRFGAVAGQYVNHRPTYPSALFAWLASLCRHRELAWDCAAGNGQASLPLTSYFGKVVATDASPAQIAQAPKAPGVEFRVAPAEDSSLESKSVDLITVAQALHWFELPRFYAEVDRVLRNDGWLAAWSYGVLQVEGDDVDRLVQQFYRNTIGPYWPAERRHVESGYQELTFPYARIKAPVFSMDVLWSRSTLLGYVRSWSATAAFQQLHGFDPVAQLDEDLVAVWGPADAVRRVTWPLALLVGQQSGRQ